MVIEIILIKRLNYFIIEVFGYDVINLINKDIIL